MATIVQMPTPRSRLGRPADDPNGATILFFTGVRYMRDEDPADDEPMPTLEPHTLPLEPHELALSVI